ALQRPHCRFQHQTCYRSLPSLCQHTSDITEHTSNTKDTSMVNATDDTSDMMEVEGLFQHLIPFDACQPSLLRYFIINNGKGNSALIQHFFGCNQLAGAHFLQGSHLYGLRFCMATICTAWPLQKGTSEHQNTF